MWKKPGACKKEEILQIRVIDLTREIHDGTESYPGDRVGIRIEHLATVKTNGHSLSRITWLDCHCGTHIDSPLHFVDGGGACTCCRPGFSITRGRALLLRDIVKGPDVVGVLSSTTWVVLAVALALSSAKGG